MVSGGSARTMLWAISDHELESVLLGQARNAHVEVRRRCSDAVELLAACAVSPGISVLVHVELPRLSAEVLSTLAAQAGELIVVASTDEQEFRARSWGHGRVVRLGVGSEFENPASIDLRGVLDNSSVHLDQSSKTQLVSPSHGLRQVVCMWSPSGSTGRSTVALGLAEAWARAGEKVLLIDADTCGPSIATAVGVVDDVSGLVIACRYAEQNSLDVRTFSSACRELQSNLWLLTGLSEPRRWPEIRGHSLTRVIAQARLHFDRVVIDISSHLPEDLDHFDETPMEPNMRLQPSRNTAGVAALQSADLVLVVVRPDAVGAARLVQDFGAHARAFAQAEKVFVLNRVDRRHKKSVIREFGDICAALGIGGSTPPMLMALPEDTVVASMHRLGATMSEVGTRSKIFNAVREIAKELTNPDSRVVDENAGRSRRRKNHHKIAYLRPLVEQLRIFGRHSNTATSSNR